MWKSINQNITIIPKKKQSLSENADIVHIQGPTLPIILEDKLFTYDKEHILKVTNSREWWYWNMKQARYMCPEKKSIVRLKPAILHGSGKGYKKAANPAL